MFYFIFVINNNNMKENIFYIIFGFVIILCMVIGTLTWVGIMGIGIIDLYEKNPNTLFITIPFVIYVHVFGYLTFTRK